MNNSVQKMTLLAAVSLSVIASTAQSAETAERFDFNNNGKIDRGAEAFELDAAIATFNPAQQRTISDFLGSDAEALSLKDISDLADADERRICSGDQEVYLAESVSSIRTYNPDVITPSDEGAQLSWSRDQITGTSTWSAHGVVAFAPAGASGCFGVGAPDTEPTGPLTAYSFVPYLSFDGTGNSTAVATSDLRLGIQSSLLFSGGVFDIQDLSISPFYRTDFQRDAEIYGLDVTWTPYHYESRLNGLQGDVESGTFDWTLNAGASYRNVQNAGNSGLVTGAEYGWLSLDTGFGYTFETSGKRAPRFAFNINANYDVINDVTAVLYDASLLMPLADTGRSYIEYSYKIGTDSESLQEVDESAILLRMSF